MADKDRSVEILAPAGSYESFQAAMAAGADAVYLGGMCFGARSFAQNFSEEELLRALDCAHLHGRKIYLTVNTLLKDAEIKSRLFSYLLPFYRQGLDAVIVQDVGVLHFIRKYFPDLEIHASTQMTVTGKEGADFLKRYQVKRVVPARELSLPEIRRLKESGLEAECFVHGALCYCYSGQCLLSSLIGGRSGNRGQCAQPCRLPYGYRGRNGYLLSLKDICTLDLIPELIEAGIDSFKIEGRMKKPEYVYGVVSVYRKYADLYAEKGKDAYRVLEEDREMLLDLYNRGGFYPGYFHTSNGPEMISFSRPNHAGVPAAKVTAAGKGEICIKALKSLRKGDVLELSGEKTAGKRERDHTLGRDVEKGKECTIRVPEGCTPAKGTVLSRIHSGRLTEELRAGAENRKIQERIHGFLKLFPGKPATLELSLSGKDRPVFVRVEGEPVQKAENRPLTEERVRSQMEKTGNMPFAFEELRISMAEDCFYPMQQLNHLRREAAVCLEQEILAHFRRSLLKTSPKETAVQEEKRTGQPPILSVSVERQEQLGFCASLKRSGRLYIPVEFVSGSSREAEENRRLGKTCRQNGWEIFLALPYILRMQAAEALGDPSLFRDVDGVLARNLESIRLLEEIGFDKTVITDHNLYVFNREAKAFWEENRTAGFTAPLELNFRELKELGISGAELVVYGHEPVMISAQCLEKTCAGCTGRSGYHMLRDRFRHLFPVKNCCAFCYNIIYNAQPLMLFGEANRIQSLSPAAYRLAFTKENQEEMQEIFRLYENTFEEGKTADLSAYSYTKGHFGRGVK